MSLASQFLIYATCFRVAIIATGALCMTLGYRLFCTGMLGNPRMLGAASLEANVAGQKFSLKNAAPGTGFGLFGVIIISVMLVQGNPEFTVKALGNLTSACNTEAIAEVRLRGTEVQSGGKFEVSVAQGLEYDKNGNVSNAISSYEDAMVSVATPMNQLAWDYLQQGRTQDAIPLARLAVQFCPRQAAFADTLAEALWKSGMQKEAVMWITKAAGLDAKYQPKMSEMKRATK